MWKDKWVGNLKIEDFVNHIPSHIQNMKVADLINWSNHTRNITAIKNICLQFILDKIYATPIPLFPQKDRIKWAFTNIGSFTIKSAYHWILNKERPFSHPNLPWNKISNLKICARIKKFIWQLSQNCLPNAKFLYQRKILDNDNCRICQQETETNQHLFLECQGFAHIHKHLPNLVIEHFNNFTSIFFYIM